MAIIPVLTKNGSQQNKATYTSSNIIPVLTKNTVTKTPTVTKSPTPTKPISQPTTSLIKKTNIAPVDNIIAKVSKEPKIGQIFEGFKNIVGQVEQSTKSYIKSAKEEPVSFTKGAVEQFGTDLAVTLTRVAGSVQKNIASQPALGIAGQGLSFKFPDRWDISKQSDAYKKQVENVLKNSPISEQRGANVGKFISDAYQFAVAGEITGATVGTKILVPTAERYLPKAIKLIPAINNVIGFTGLGQLQYDKTQDSSRIDKLKSDIIMAGLFEAIPILSKGLTKGTKESISKLVGKTAKDLKSPTGAEIDALEKEITTVKDAIENDTGKKAEVIFTQNVAKASDQQLKEVSAKELGFKEGENKVTKISIDKIDSGLSPLMKDKKLNVDSMIDTLKKGEDLPAIPVYKDGEKFILNSDGNRRYQAYKQAGIKEVPVKIEAKTSMTPLAKNNAERKIVADDGEAGLYDTGSVDDFLSKKLGGSSELYDKTLGSRVISTGKDNIRYTIKEADGEIRLFKILADKKGTGVGTEFMNGLKEYADSTGKPIKIMNPTNEKFWSKFPYLSKSGGRDLKYDPRVAQQPVGDIKPKTVSVPREQLPVKSKEGVEKVSRLEARVTESLNKTPQEIKDQLGSTYTAMNKKEQISKASRYVNEKPDEAMAVLRGEKEAPKDILKNSIYVAMENQAKEDIGLARRLASLQSTRAGQELSILTEIDPSSPVKIMRDLVKVREEAFKLRYKGQQAKEVSKKVVADIQKKVKKPDKYDWNRFVDSIQC